MADLFGGEIELLARALDLRSQRNTLIASNLANADTPGYKAVKMHFEDVLSEMIQSKGSQPMQATQPKHFTLGGKDGGGEPEMEVRSGSDRADGNSVDGDEEMIQLITNQVQYDANVDAMTRVFKLLDYAVEEGGR